MANQNNEQMQEAPKKRRRIFNRRNFLIGGAIVLGGSAAALYFGRTPLRRQTAQMLGEMEFPHGINTLNPDFLFEMQEDNTLLMRVAKAEMGQGVFTGIAMMAVEELDISLSQVKVVPNSTTSGMIDTLGTGGSASTSALYVPIRESAATFREMLKSAAAKLWSVDVSQVSTADGFVSAGSEQMSYVDVVNATSEWEIPETPALRPASSFKVIGSEQPRIDLKSKVMGEPIFGLDAELPNMLHANILKCPYIEGNLKGMDITAAEAVSGVVQIVQEEDLIAVLAESRYAAEMGKRALNAEWDIPKMWQQAELEERNTVGKSSPVNLQRDGDVNTYFADSSGTLVEAEYRTPYGVHAHMEPNGAIADFQGDRVLIITGTQAPSRVRDDVAAALDIEADNVELQNSFLGGGFGRRYYLNPGPDAARLSRLTGRPVHLVWDRETEFLCSPVRPATHHVLRAKVDDDGTLAAIEHNVASGDQILTNFPSPIPLLPIFGADLISAGHGTSFVYEVENRDASIWHIDMPFPTSIWRAVGMFPNGFAVESFMDEVAHAAGQDPFDLRLAYLQGKEEEKVRRMHDVLVRLREESGWDSPKAEGVGRGLAVIEDRRTIAATVIEAKVEEGQIRVVKATSAIDPGVVINPEGVRMQVEGCVMMGISASLYEETVVEDGQFSATNYHQYPMALLMDTPAEVSVILMEGSENPSGVGEPPMGPIAPAIANAVFDATGTRLRQLPLQKALSQV